MDAPGGGPHGGIASGATRPRPEGDGDSWRSASSEHASWMVVESGTEVCSGPRASDTSSFHMRSLLDISAGQGLSLQHEKMASQVLKRTLLEREAELREEREVSLRLRLQLLREGEEHREALKEMARELEAEATARNEKSSQVMELSHELALARRELLRRSEGARSDAVSLETEAPPPCAGQVARVMDECRTLRNTLAAVRRERDSAEERWAACEAHRNQRDAEMQELRHRLHQMDIQASERRMQLEHAEGRCSLLQREAEEAAARLRSNAEATQVLRQHEGLLQEELESSRRDCEALRGIVMELTARYQECEAECATLRVGHSLVEQRERRVREESEALRRELGRHEALSASTEVAEAQIADLTASHTLLHGRTALLEDQLQLRTEALRLQQDEVQQVVAQMSAVLHRCKEAMKMTSRRSATIETHTGSESDVECGETVPPHAVDIGSRDVTPAPPGPRSLVPLIDDLGEAVYRCCLLQSSLCDENQKLHRSHAEQQEHTECVERENRELRRSLAAVEQAYTDRVADLQNLQHALCEALTSRRDAQVKLKHQEQLFHALLTELRGEGAGATVEATPATSHSVPCVDSVDGGPHRLGETSGPAVAAAAAEAAGQRRAGVEEGRYQALPPLLEAFRATAHPAASAAEELKACSCGSDRNTSEDDVPRLTASPSECWRRERGAETAGAAASFQPSTAFSRKVLAETRALRLRIVQLERNDKKGAVEHAAAVRRLREANRTLREKLQAMTAERQGAMEEKERLQAQLAAAEGRVAELRADAAAQREQHRLETHNMATGAADLQQMLRVMEARLAAAEEKSRVLEQDLVTLQWRADDARHLSMAFEQQLQQLQVERSALLIGLRNVCRLLVGVGSRYASIAAQKQVALRLYRLQSDQVLADASCVARVLLTLPGCPHQLEPRGDALVSRGDDSSCPSIAPTSDHLPQGQVVVLEQRLLSSMRVVAIAILACNRMRRLMAGAEDGGVGRRGSPHHAGSSTSLGSLAMLLRHPLPAVDFGAAAEVIAILVKHHRLTESSTEIDGENRWDDAPWTADHCDRGGRCDEEHATAMVVEVLGLLRTRDAGGVHAAMPVAGAEVGSPVGVAVQPCRSSLVDSLRRGWLAFFGRADPLAGGNRSALGQSWEGLGHDASRELPLRGDWSACAAAGDGAGTSRIPHPYRLRWIRSNPSATAQSVLAGMLGSHRCLVGAYEQLAAECAKLSLQSDIQFRLVSQHEALLRRYAQELSEEKQHSGERFSAEYVGALHRRVEELAQVVDAERQRRAEAEAALVSQRQRELSLMAENYASKSETRSLLIELHSTTTPTNPTASVDVSLAAGRDARRRCGE